MSAIWWVIFYECHFRTQFSNSCHPQLFWGKLLKKIGTISQSQVFQRFIWLHVLYWWNPLWHSLSHKVCVMKIRKVSTISSFPKFIGSLPVVWLMNIQGSSPMCQNMLWIIYSCRLKSCPFSFGNVCINTDVSISCYWNCILNILCSKLPALLRRPRTPTYTCTWWCYNCGCQEEI